MVGRVTEESVFQVRLNELFAATGRRLTNKTVASGLAASGCRISVPYLSQLRTGAREAPSREVVTALASYFRVSSGYFFTVPWNGDRMDAVDADTNIIALLFDSQVRALLQASNGLSAESLNLLVDLATKLKAADPGHRRPIPPPHTSNHTRGAPITRAKASDRDSATKGDAASAHSPNRD